MQLMAQVIPFRPWLYDTEAVGPLECLIAPPYDVITPALRDELYQRSPYNVVRLDLNRAPGPERYREAARLWGEWQAGGVLRRASQPQVTVVEETFVGPDGRNRVRRGVLALVRLADFSEGVVFPHEHTLSAPKEDRYLLMEATQAAFSPVFFLYLRPDDAVMAAWTRLADHPPDATISPPATPAEGGRREILRVWHSSHPSFHETITSSLAEQPLIIADGHHRYETALRFRNARRAEAAAAGVAGGRPQTEASSPRTEYTSPLPPYEYVLAYLVNMADPGLAVFATHRLVRGLPPEKIARLPLDLAGHFFVEQLADSVEEAAEVIPAFLERHQEGPTALGLFLAASRTAYGIHLRPEFEGRPFSETAERNSETYRSLDVTVLQDLVLGLHLGLPGEHAAQNDQLAFVKDWEEAFASLVRGDYQVGFFLNPTRLDQVRRIALAGERMPQKSTYFYPKLPTGLLFHDLRHDS